jgi:predicted AlkP superfamily phosphohydrolase/phosphomutase
VAELASQSVISRFLLPALLFGAFAASCGTESGDSGSSTSGSAGASNGDLPPVVVVGMDGLEWAVMKPLLEAGKLPNFQKLIDRGVAGGLSTFQPTFSPVVWTSIATGVPREKHGIMYFSEWVNGRPKPNGLPYTSNSRKVPAIWNIASDHDRDVLNVGWWVSWPAEKVLGRVVASYAAQAQGQLLWKPGVWKDGLPKLTYPDAMIDVIKPHLDAGAPDGPVRSEYEEHFNRIEPTTLSPTQDPWRFPRERDAFFRISYHADRTHLAIFKEQLEEYPAALNMVYFGVPDVAGHFWWRYRESQDFQYSIPQDQIDFLRDRVDLAYTAADGFLGEIVDAAPENARIMVVSDHGMHGGNFSNPRAVQSGLHEDAPPGVLIIAGPGIRKEGLKPTVEWSFPVVMPGPGGRAVRKTNKLMAPESVGGVYDITPTLLDWLEIPTAMDMSGKSLRQHMEQPWLDGHPVKTVDSYGIGYRAATVPLVPGENLNELFTENILEQMGYGDGLESMKALEQDQGKK